MSTALAGLNETNQLTFQGDGMTVQDKKDVLGVFAWEAKNMYLNESALRTFTHEKTAKAYCDLLNKMNDYSIRSKLYNQGGYVIRPLRKGTSQL